MRALAQGRARWTGAVLSLLLGLVLGLSAGCSGGSSSSTGADAADAGIGVWDASLPEVSPVDGGGGGDAKLPPVDTLPDAEPPLDAADGGDARDVDAEPPQDVADGGADAGVDAGGSDFGAVCEGDGDCDSGRCVWGPEGRVCTRGCDGDCPQGWGCVEVAGADGAAERVCLYAHVQLCAPCLEDGDCVEARSGGAAWCVAAEADAPARFCATSCGESAPCPQGYRCEDASDTLGFPASVCVPDEPCGCSPYAAAEGAPTACLRENEFGACEGTRVCTPEGFGPCEGPEPAADECDGVDDDCDGETDEAFVPADCENTNEIGACPGTTVCRGGEIVCDGPAPSAETCDGTDEDCDGATDEDFPDSDADGVADCADPDDDGDGRADGEDNCPLVANPGQEDANGNGVGDACEECVDECAADETGCDPSGLPWACGFGDDGDACLDRVPGAACASGTGCVDGLCVTLCEDECLLEETGCDADGRPWACGLGDADECLHRLPQEPCAPGDFCVAGDCVAGCSNECEIGQAGCDPDGMPWVCGYADDGDPCLDQVPGIACESPRVCVDGVCRIVCEDACAFEGETGCVDDLTPWTCEDADGDGCLDRRELPPCGVDEACEEGSCESTLLVPGLVLTTQGSALVSGAAGGRRVHVGVGTGMPMGLLVPAGGRSLELGVFGALRD